MNKKFKVVLEIEVDDEVNGDTIDAIIYHNIYNLEGVNGIYNVEIREV